MRKIWLVIKREYLTRVRTKGFILSTIGLPLFSIGIFAFSMTLMTRQADHTLKISILDNLGGLTPQIATGLEEKLPDGRPLYQVVRSWDRLGDGGKIRAGLDQQIRDGQLDGFLVLPEDILRGNAATYQTRNPEDFQTIQAISRAVDNAVVARLMAWMV
jgi:ABC-2 type transport system permease protein